MYFAKWFFDTHLIGDLKNPSYFFFFYSLIQNFRSNSMRIVVGDSLNSVKKMNIKLTEFVRPAAD